ncbi:MAG: hypothetical protein ACOCZ8_06920, partial [Bacteroidota bacterium]
MLSTRFVLIVALLLLPLLCPLKMSAQTDFDALWQRHEALTKERKTRDASALMDTILQKAKAERATPHYVRAVGYVAKYQVKLEDEESVKNLFAFLDKEIEDSYFPARPLLMVSTADVYWTYYERNRWRFMERGETDNPDMADVSTWDLRTLSDHVRALYLGALAEADKLQAISSEDYKALLAGGSSFTVKRQSDLNPAKGTRRGDHLFLLQYGEIDKLDKMLLRPTLYDMVAFKALEFFRNHETGLTQAAETFQLDNPAVLHTSQAFLDLNLTTPDSSSHTFWAATLFQDLLRFHTARKSDPHLLVELETDRLAWAEDKAVRIDDKPERYFEALQKLEELHRNHPASTIVTHKIAQHLRANLNPREGVTLQAVDEKCAGALERFPRSIGAYRCFGMRIELRLPELNTAALNVNPTQQHLPIEVGYKGFDTAYWRLLKLTDQQRETYVEERYQDKKVKYLKSLDPMRAGKWALPQKDDLHKHSLHQALEPLPPGYYVLLASDNPAFSNEATLLKSLDDVSKSRGIITYKGFQVS